MPIGRTILLALPAAFRQAPRGRAAGSDCASLGIETVRDDKKEAVMATRDKYEPGTPSWIDLSTSDAGAARESINLNRRHRFKNVRSGATRRVAKPPERN